MKIEKDEVIPTLLQLSEEKDSLNLKYKDQLQNIKKVQDEDLKGKVNEKERASNCRMIWRIKRPDLMKIEYQ